MIRLHEVTKEFHVRGRPVRALDCVNLRVENGELVVLRGPSGCGKTTLLSLVAGLQHATSGTVEVGNESLGAMSGAALARLRRQRIGMVFQMFHLLPYLDALDNVMVSRFAGAEVGEDRARALLVDLGMGDRLAHRPEELSTGERQRVALARALLPEPDILLADEPTGNLDPSNTAMVLEQLYDYHTRGHTVIVATHESELGLSSVREVTLAEGRIAAEDTR